MSERATEQLALERNGVSSCLCKTGTHPRYNTLTNKKIVLVMMPTLEKDRLSQSALRVAISRLVIGTSHCKTIHTQESADVGAKKPAYKATGGRPVEGTRPRAEPCWGSADVGTKTPANKAIGGRPIEGTSPRAEPCWGSADVGGRPIEGTSPRAEPCWGSADVGTTTKAAGRRLIEGMSPRAEPCWGLADVGVTTPTNKVTGDSLIENTSPRAEPCGGSADVGAKPPAGEAAAASQPASEARGEVPPDAAETARRMQRRVRFADKAHEPTAPEEPGQYAHQGGKIVSSSKKQKIEALAK